MKVNQQGKMKAWKEKIRKEARLEEKGEGSIMENREDSKEKKKRKAGKQKMFWSTTCLKNKQKKLSKRNKH